MDASDSRIRQEQINKIKLGESYSNAVDSGYESIYNACSSVLMEKTLSKDIFDIFSPGSEQKRTPSKRSSSIKYHISTPKSDVCTKRHFCKTFNSTCNSSKRIKWENNENEPELFQSKVSESEAELINPKLVSNDLNNIGLLDRRCLFSANAANEFTKNNYILNLNTQSCRRNKKEQVLIPERPCKSQRYFAPSVKRSKRKLEITPVKEKKIRTYCGGMRYLNIIRRLEAFPAILDDIFKNLSNKDLLNMSLVTKNWNKIVKSNFKANGRLQKYLNESHDVKENRQHQMKLTIGMLDRYPFGEFNQVSSFNNYKNKNPVNGNFRENQNVVQHLLKNEKLVKCPRCGKASIVSNSLERLQINLQTRIPLTTLASQSAINIVIKPETYSINLTSRDKSDPSETKSSFGYCTSLSCKYTFCTKCLCDQHPGESCKISEPESPSKLLICRKNSKLKSKSDCKQSSKRQSLRRLCFS